MEIKQKHGKHALRKAVTAAVLAGTAFSSLGGFAGAVTTVKAEEFTDKYYPKMNKMDEEDLLRLSAESKKDVPAIRELLKRMTTESIHALLVGLDSSHISYSEESGFNNLLRKFGSMNNDDPSDWTHYKSGVSLASIIVQEVRSRLNEKDELDEELSNKKEELQKLTEKIEKTIKEKENLNKEITEKNSEISKMEEELSEKEKEIAENKEELADALGELFDAEETIDKKEAKVKDLTEKLDASRKEHEALAKEFAESQKGYEKELADKHNALGEAEKRNADLEAGNKELKENLEMAEGISDDLQKKVMKAEQEMKEISAQLEAEKAKLAEVKEANDKLTEERDAAKKEAEKVPELEEQVEKLVEEITAAKKEAEELQEKAEALEKDFEAVKADKEKLEAEIARMKEDHQKEVDALNALLADKEKMLKNLQDQLDKAKEEAMKNEQMSQEEKAKLQAELDKAKQELADKIKDMPNKVAPQAEGKANAGQAAPNQNNQAQANQAKNANNLPSTGDKPVNPLLVASGLSLMIGAGAFVYAGKRKKG